MNKPSRSSGVAIVAVAILVARSRSVEAQSVPDHRTGSPFIQTKSHVLNPDHIDHVDFGVTGDGSKASARVFFAGSPDAFTLVGEEAEQLRAAFGGKSSRNLGEGVGADAPRLLLFDDFDGTLGLHWKPVRPDPSHVSLAKNPGALTITTQRGSIHGEETKDEFGEGVQAKNLYLIDNPLAKDADFVATTCVSGFTPAMPYQQAGLIVYDDDDSYLKWGYEYNWQKEGGGQAFCILTETDAKSDFHYIEGSESGLKRYWLRLAKRGNRFEYATSTDGKDFRVHGEVAWGDGAPKRVGILAKNGGNKDATESDASFEFFELRAPVAPPRGDAGRKD